MSKIGRRKGKEKMLFVTLIIVVVIAAGLWGGILYDAPGRREIGELTFPDVKLENLSDGSFIGEFKGTKSHFRDTKVEIAVSGGKISKIKILKGALNKQGEPAKLTGGQSIDDLFKKVIDSKTLRVDVISGATLTSKSHLKALENALKQAQIER